MAQPTRISEEFGRLVLEIMNGDSYGKASIKTGISAAYLLHMARGKVPSEPIIDQFLQGYKASNRTDELKLAAGYISPSNPVQAVHFALRSNGKISEKAMEQIENFVKKILEQEAKEESEKGQGGQT